ncbi:HotDog domain-containing protein [Lipomyces japonicus]|uniref:HotDog domain-containing protein n=1 Tax=Lipomyces japonicus TaxID=56871 RepID=UPI0034CD72E4
MFASSSASQVRASKSRASIAGTALVAAGSLVAGAVFAYKVPPLTLLTMFRERLPEPGSAEEQAFKAKIEHELQQSPVLAKYRADPNFAERRMWFGTPEQYRKHAFLSGALDGAGKFAVPGIVFTNEKDNRVVSVIHVGSQLAGFPTIVHGGLIASLLDESLARAAILPLPSRTAVTANLDINYKLPTFVNQVVSIETYVTENTDRKSLVAGTVKNKSGVVVAEATGVFVVPKKFKLQSLENM